MSATPASPARIPGIDAVRYAGFCAVVLGHTMIPEGTRGMDAGVAAVYLARFAVPFFFAASGYFMPRAVDRVGSRILDLARRLLPVYFVWIAIYVLAFDGDLHRLSSPQSIARMLWTGLPGYHLWFVPALLFASSAFLVLRRFFGWGRC